MRNNSQAAEAIICSFRSMSPIGAKAGDRLAETLGPGRDRCGMRSPYAARAFVERRARRRVAAGRLEGRPEPPDLSGDSCQTSFWMRSFSSFPGSVASSMIARSKPGMATSGPMTVLPERSRSECGSHARLSPWIAGTSMAPVASIRRQARRLRQVMPPLHRPTTRCCMSSAPITTFPKSG